MAPRKPKKSVNARLDMARLNISAAALPNPRAVETNPFISDKMEKSIEQLNASSSSTLSEEVPLPDCICDRASNTLVCIFCKMFSFGRICKPCAAHPNVTFLMDFTCCPFCGGPAKHLHVVEMDYAHYFQT